MNGRALSILQFGTTGQLALGTIRAAARRSHIRLQALGRETADFGEPARVSDAVRNARHLDVVVNTAAYTAVDRAESEEALAQLVNATSVAALAAACRERDVPLIHISTDYVFDGAKTAPYIEDDVTNPINAYGRTKLAGEHAIRLATAEHAIVRTSWLYGAHGANFVRTMLRLGRQREELRVVDDQHGSPTSSRDLAGVVLDMAERMVAGGGSQLFGTFHYASSGETTWKRFAETIFEETQEWACSRNTRVVGIHTAEYGALARRPMNSRLDCSKIESSYGVKRPPWEISLAEILRDLRRAEERGET